MLLSVEYGFSVPAAISQANRESSKPAFWTQAAWDSPWYGISHYSTVAGSDSRIGDPLGELAAVLLLDVLDVGFMLCHEVAGEYSKMSRSASTHTTSPAPRAALLGVDVANEDQRDGHVERDLPPQVR